MLTDMPIGKCADCGGVLQLGIGHLGVYIYCDDCGTTTEDDEED
jgi:hypothetical protein